ncbi:MAG: zinc-finger domain-containing protein [Phenylobacterium sp.]
MARTASTKAPAKRTGKVKAVSPTVAAATPGAPAAIPPPEVITVRSRRVACDGVGGALGHPRVYLEMGEADFVECTYCDRRFVLATGSEGPESEYLAPGVYEGSHGH